jgi:signal transduction histidine kinase
MNTENPRIRTENPRNNMTAAMSEVLHQTAQPLTVLLGILELALLQAETITDYRESVERSLFEVTRLIDCLNQARKIAVGRA